MIRHWTKYITVIAVLGVPSTAIADNVNQRNQLEPSAEYQEFLLSDADQEGCKPLGRAALMQSRPQEEEGEGKTSLPTQHNEFTTKEKKL